MKLEVGKTYICVNSQPATGCWDGHTPLILGNRYTVQRLLRGGVTCTLREVFNPSFDDGDERGYYHWHFGELPAVEEKSDTTVESILESMSHIAKQ